MTDQPSPPASLSQSSDAPDIGRCILEHREAIIARWEHQSRAENPDARDEQRLELRNSLPEFLELLGKMLSRGSTRPLENFAIEHGIQRWRIGWDIASLARDFMVLRRVLITHLRQHVRMDIDVDDVVALSSMLEVAVAESVGAYVEHRELELNRKNEELERKNYELKRFAHMVAHEVRNPLGVIAIAGAALQREAGGDGSTSRHVERIIEGKAQIVEVVDNLVRYASGVGGEDFQPDHVPLEGVYDEALDHLKYTIQAAGATITRDALPTVRGNAVALRSVFQNLVENALKYAGDSPPRIHVSARHEPARQPDSQRAHQLAHQPPHQRDGQPPHQTPHQTDGVWAIAFRDEGVGIARQDQAEVFRFLSRANADQSIPGSGVGLALCRRVAEQHGGTITVQSQSGKGSTFTLRLPS